MTYMYIQVQSEEIVTHTFEQLHEKYVDFTLLIFMWHDRLFMRHYLYLRDNVYL